MGAHASLVERVSGGQPERREEGMRGVVVVLGKRTLRDRREACGILERTYEPQRELGARAALRLARGDQRPSVRSCRYAVLA